MSALAPQIARAARTALPALTGADIGRRNGFLGCLSRRLRCGSDRLLAANHEDMQRAQSLPESLQDRLRLTPARIDALATAVEHLAALPDPLGQRFDARVLDNGLRLHRRRVPLGVLGVIYEARPNVTLDIAALAIKTGNAAVLRGGKEALASNRALVACVHDALREAGLPDSAIGFIDTGNRDEVLALLGCGDDVDLVIPRGGADLHAFCRQHARMPVVTGGIGICHLYVDRDVDAGRALDVIHNAKTQRPTVCNALDTVLVHRDIAIHFVPALVRRLRDAGVELRLDAAALATLDAAGRDEGVVAAVDGDYDREWLSLVLGVAVVGDMDAAIAHIRAHSSGHSDGILCNDPVLAARFLDEVDSAAVYWNASTRFTDGGEFGLGAEVAVSTQRVHARGPMGLEQLTSYKWVVEGDYHVRA
ncbi:glutamate-5-semialdehyde dehydrogenase [Pseudofulvimonas gallinarii]|uniref:Gamma-glutamyl phosphate reductase n=1 Tax=Pseudofulvimonas gallinarii TaxID=634155 RepID=A0A4S3KXZ6_9GAMM|nr:glutamate-5-semialdehyde dehydrogenase [Pseudofulvimonas gallinarii]TCT00288.1 glutamate-5-semialdehyde dehydrogenase [Pseudofulvimonas gallinarii]THD14130.1 glutamate-5-semialdehyde dehydrogenase [Pseudofulvimonas gallinarii]